MAIRNFENFNYQETRTHLEEHKIFIEKINSFEKEIKENPGRQVFPIIKFLQEWIINHIGTVDVKYVDLFKKNNIF